jgi:hypothetical protein
MKNTVLYFLIFLALLTMSSCSTQKKMTYKDGCLVGTNPIENSEECSYNPNTFNP